VENSDGILCIVWDKEEGVEGSNRAADVVCTTIQKLREAFDGKWVEEEYNCPNYSLKTGIFLAAIYLEVTESLPKDCYIELVNS
jgi:hypothetical protein